MRVPAPGVHGAVSVHAMNIFTGLSDVLEMWLRARTSLNATRGATWLEMERFSIIVD